MTSFVSHQNFSHLPLWKKIANKRIPLDFYLEITARCNNNCRHCYINLPGNNQNAKREELSVAEISHIADQAVELGALWCLITGGEPLLREDFFDVYSSLRNKGLLLSVFTNACLITEKHISFFQENPPRDIEVTVYGATAETYEKVTRKPGSYQAFRRGLDLLLASGIKIRLKAVALRSNIHELSEIAAFCRQRSDTTFRFDPVMHLRFDQNPKRNREIIAERLSPDEIVAIEQADNERLGELKKYRDSFIFPKPNEHDCNHLFHCGAGAGSFVVSYDGIFRLCADLWHADCIFDLRKGTLAEAWEELVPRVQDMPTRDPEYLAKCHSCEIVNLCLWCPAHAHLETGDLESFVPYFCQVAHARAEALQASMAHEDE